MEKRTEERESEQKECRRNVERVKRHNAFEKGIVMPLRNIYGRLRWNLMGMRVHQESQSIIRRPHEEKYADR